MKLTPLLIVLAALALPPAWGAETWCSTAPATRVMERYIAEISESLKSLDLDEWRTRDDRKDFFTANLGLPVGAIDTVVESREMLLRKPSGRQYHLGVAELTLSASGAAALAAQRDPQAMQRLKVLTQYVVLRSGPRALIIYSENLRDPQVAKFFGELTSDGRLWKDDCVD